MAKSLPLFIDFATRMSYNNFRHICRKVGLLMNKRGQETRKHIKKCACSLFAEKGFKQVTMKDICDVTKLSRGGLYCHYESTRQIFQEIVDDMASEQENEIDLRIEQNGSAVTILDEILNKYEKEMLDSQSSLSIAIYEYFSIRDIANQSNTLYEQYLISANTWKKLIQYGMDRQEFNEVDISAVFDLIVFSYQGVRMYSKLMPMDKETPSRNKRKKNISEKRQVIKILLKYLNDKNALLFLEFLKRWLKDLKLKIIGSGGMSIIPSSFCKCKFVKKRRKAAGMNG